jgi:hypothetical protein
MILPQIMIFNLHWWKEELVDADKPLTVEEVRRGLNLRFERLNMKILRNEECEFWKIKLYSVGILSENVKIVVKLGTSHFNARIVQTTMVEITVTELEQTFGCIFANQAITRRVASSSKKKEAQNGYASNFNGNAYWYGSPIFSGWVFSTLV